MLRYSREEKYSKPETVQEMLKLALKREKASIAFYNDMLKHNISAEIKQFIVKLRDEEQGHINNIEFKIKELEHK